MLSRVRLWCVLSGCVVVLSLTGISLAQEKSAPQSKPKAKKEDQSLDRLPRNWGMLELSEEQKQRIYAINRKAKDSVEAAEKEVLRLREEYAKARQELAKVRLQIDQERVNVLTDAQKEKLTAMREQTKSRIEEALKTKLKLDRSPGTASTPKEEK